MILARLGRAVGEQNWFAVVIELVLVIAGVVIGFQITAWNEERQLRDEERAALVRLQDESEGAVAYWRAAVAASAAGNAHRRVFLQVLHAGAVTSDQEPAVDAAINGLFHYPATNPPRAVLDEMIASGGMARVSDLEARTALSRYTAELAFVDGQLTQFRLNMPQYLRAYEGRILSVYAPDEPSLRHFSYDIGALSRDSLFRSDILDLVRDQLQFHTYRVHVLREAERMCAAVSAALLTPCEPDPSALVDRTGVNPGEVTSAVPMN